MAGKTAPKPDTQRIISGHFGPQTLRAFRRLAVSRGMTNRELLLEAVGDILAKYEEEPTSSRDAGPLRP